MPCTVYASRPAPRLVAEGLDPRVQSAELGGGRNPDVESGTPPLFGEFRRLVGRLSAVVS
jgi:hypothetical protein